MRAAVGVCVVLGGLAGCSRKLSEVTDREAQPVYLGNMSGLHELSLLMEVDPVTGVSGTELPYRSRLKILHLRNTFGGDDLLLGIEEANVISGSDYRRLFFEANFDGTDLDVLSNRGLFTGKRVAGGSLLKIDGILSVCEAGSRYDLVGRLQCPVNPALSGLYSGEANDCSTGESLGERYLAMAFIGDSFLGLSFPGPETLVEGVYNHLEETGAGSNDGLEWNPTGVVDSSELSFTLSQVENRLELDGQLSVVTVCDSQPCPEPLCEAISLSRLVGGTTNECPTSVTPTVETRIDFGDNGDRYLYVETENMKQARGILRRADDPETVIEGEPPDPCTANCACDLDCCSCDLDPLACDLGCDCDQECSTCSCGTDGDGVCAGDCRCDLDCLSVCTCNSDATCSDACFCDPDCFCDCELPPGFALRFRLPAVSAASTVVYEQFLEIYEPYVTGIVPIAPRCIVDDGTIGPTGP